MPESVQGPCAFLAHVTNGRTIQPICTNPKMVVDDAQWLPEPTCRGCKQFVDQQAPPPHKHVRREPELMPLPVAPPAARPSRGSRFTKRGR